MKDKIKLYGFWGVYISNNCFLKYRLNTYSKVKEIISLNSGMGIKKAYDIYKERLFE